MAYIKNWFSNLLPLDTPFTYQGITFSTVENFYQAMKLPKDNVSARRSIAAMSPYAAKKAIRNRDQFPWRTDWDTEIALRVMEYALRIKFAPSTTWATKLLATGTEELLSGTTGTIFSGARKQPDKT